MMPLQVTFEHLSGSRKGDSESVDRESILIGRGGANDIALDAFRDPTVSLQHAEIRLEAGEAVLYDMGSLNGTFLNGVAVRRAELQAGDRISLGRTGPSLRIRLGHVGGAGSARAVQIPVVGIEPGHTVPEEILAVDVGNSAPRSRWPWLWMLAGGVIVAALALVFRAVI